MALFVSKSGIVHFKSGIVHFKKWHCSFQKTPSKHLNLLDKKCDTIRLINYIHTLVQSGIVHFKYLCVLAEIGKIVEFKDIPTLEEKRNEITPIRIDSEFSLFPCHNIEKRSNGHINITVQGKDGSEINWGVTPNAKWGMPGELAYRIDSQLINRRLNSYKKTPKFLLLGSFRSIARELPCSRQVMTLKIKDPDTGKVQIIRKCNIEIALRRNASASIDTNLSYRTVNGTRKILSGQLQRYQLFLSSQELPDGTITNEVCIWFNDWYRTFLDNVVKRPLDYNYLRLLKPTGQRFYELVSPKIYAALRRGLSTARYLYSDFCLRVPQKRYSVPSHMRRQMKRVLEAHQDLGYIEKFEFQPTATESGKDWWIIITPGIKAKQEFSFFNNGSCLVTDGKKQESLNQVPQIESESENQVIAANLVKQFHRDFRGKRISRPSTKEIILIANELHKHSQEKVHFWLDYANKESQRTQYKVATVNGILKYREESYSYFDQIKVKDAVNETQRAQYQQQQRLVEEKKISLKEQAKEQAKMLKPEIIASLRGEVEQRLEKLRNCVSKKHFEDAIECGIEELILERFLHID